MTRPAIDPRNIRRQQTGYKKARTVARGLFWLFVTFVTVALFVLIASIDTLIP